MREQKQWPFGQQFSTFMSRTEPGPGHAAADDGVPGDAKLHTRSIPNVPTERLQRRMSVLHETVRTSEGLRAWDQSRRSLIEQSMKAKMVEHELRLRGVE